MQSNVVQNSSPRLIVFRFLPEKGNVSPLGLFEEGGATGEMFWTTFDCILVPARQRQCEPNWGFARKEEEQAVEEEEEDEEEGGGGRRKEERRGGGSGRKEVFHLFLAVMSRQ
jgi:hypothetical protein